MMELHQMIASVALKAIEAVEQLRFLERREHEHRADQLVDKLEKAEDDLRDAQFEVDRLDALRSEHVGEITSLREVVVNYSKTVAEIAKDRDRLQGAVTHSAEVIESYETERKNMIDEAFEKDEIIGQLRAVANSIRIAEPDGDGDVWLHIDTPTQKASFNLGKDYELVSIAGSALRVFETQRQAALKRGEG